MTALFAPLAPLFGALVRLRNLAWSRGWLRQARLPVPVLSVGNLVVGGTGKTPIVAALARRFRDLGYSVAIVSRGYGRSSSGVVVVSAGAGPRVSWTEAGDEPFLLARELPGVSVIVGAERALAGDQAIRDLGADVILLDDGFQHRKLARDLDIVVLDASIDHERLRLLPAGPLREPLGSLARAQVVLLTRTHRPHDEVGIRRVVRLHNAEAPIYAVEPRFTGLVGPRGEDLPLDRLGGARVLALSGIGNPAQFEADLEELGAVLVGRLRHRDHHRYRARDLARIRGEAERRGAAWIVTTLKDRVRLEPLGLEGLPLLALRLEVVVRDAPELNRMLEGLLVPRARAGN